MQENDGESTQALPVQRMQCMEVWGGNQQADRRLEMPGLEAWIFSQPYEHAQGGGDVYYVSSCASGRITRMLLADVSGHGADASQTAIGLRELMRRNVNIIQQTKFVRAMNEQFGELDQQQRFATALVCSFFSPTRQFTLCNAGHPEPLYLSQNQRQWKTLSQQPAEQQLSDIPLGVLDETSYSQQVLTLEPGDLVLLFSDAFIESAGADDKMLGSAGLLSLVEQIDPSEPSELIPKLIAALKNLNPKNLSDDDATVLLIRATETRPTTKNTLLAPLRLLGSVKDRTELKER